MDFTPLARARLRLLYGSHARLRRSIFWPPPRAEATLSGLLVAVPLKSEETVLLSGIAQLSPSYFFLLSSYLAAPSL